MGDVRTIASLLIVLAASGCTMTHTRRIPVDPIAAPPEAAGTLVGLLAPTKAKFTIADAPEGSLLHIVKVNDRFLLVGDIAASYHQALRTKLAERGTPFGSAGAGAPWEAKVSEGQYVLETTIETVEIKNVLKRDGLNVVPGELTFDMVAHYRFYSPGVATPFVKFQTGPYAWTTTKRNIDDVITSALLATADWAARCFQGLDVGDAGATADCRKVAKAIADEQAKAVSKLEAKLAPLEVAGDHAGMLFVLSDAIRGCSNPTACNLFFERMLAVLKKLPARPPLSEDGRRLAIQAEAAAKEKRYDDAIRLFGEAVRACPWWPDGYFNAALLLSEQQRYAEAIPYMIRFVSLVPETPDARKGQDKIYEWEGKVKK